MKRLLLFLPLLLTACGPNMAEIIGALAKDPATIRLDITSPWGSIHLDRSNPGAVQVPVQVVPVPAGPMTTAPPAVPPVH